MIALVDLAVSNVRSVVRACDRIGIEPVVTTDAEVVAAADLIVIPGVGGFPDGMASLRAKGLVDVLGAQASQGVPIVGICLGMQLLSSSSEEHGEHQGLGLVPGRVLRLRPDRPGDRVPNVGWCDLRLAPGQELLPAELDGRAAYFTHSYHMVCDDSRDVVATIDYSGQPIPVAVARGNLVGVQFHPEKSQDVGLTVLQSIFRRLAPQESSA